jgi:hypothetical protein
MDNYKLYFVFLGKSLPHYAVSSIELAQKYSGMEVHLLGNRTQKKQIEKLGIEFTGVEDFYDPSEFAETAKNLSLSSDYRNGFWLKTLERFFVLEQFMSFKKIHKIFHAELDQLLFRTDLLVLNIEKTGKKGVFYPFHTKQRAVASVFFCNDQNALRNMLEFARSSSSFENEMELLANWARENPKYAIRLPTMASFKENSDEQIADHLNSSVQIDGVVDAAQLGQWITGIDPRNVPLNEKPKTHFVDRPNSEILTELELSNLVFSFDSSSGILSVSKIESENIPIFNLHVHSKIHKWLNRRDVSRLLKLANSKHAISLRTSRNQQLLHSINPGLVKSIFSLNKIHSFIKYRINLKLKLRPGSSPFISGDTFRNFADHVWEENNETIQISDINNGEVIFCESDALGELVEKILKKIDCKVTLLLGNSDQNFGLIDFEKIPREKIITIFAQNLTDPLKEVLPLPIGIENRWRANNGKVNSFRIRRLFPKKKIHRIMWTFSTATNPTQRTQARNQLQKVEMADHLDSVKATQHRKLLSQYAFVACPPGNGLDTHRIWEAMYLRCVPIVLRSPMTEHFASLGLPIWIVDSFEELTAYDDKKLFTRYFDLLDGFNSEALWFEFWKKRIQSKLMV